MNTQRLMILSKWTKYIIPKLTFTSHTETCPVSKQGSSNSGDKSPKSDVTLKRAIRSGKVRLGFIPEEYFVFFYPKTGVTGSYLFGILLANYMFSKEIFVMEHEYYVGLSILVITIYSSKKLGPMLAASLDKGVDAYETSLNSTRKEEEMYYENIVKQAKDAQWRAEGQKLLMDAKKENVAMQLEAAFRTRQMQVFRAVKQRLDYHMHRHRIETRIQQKWIKTWIVESVIKSITADIENQILGKAIADLNALSERGHYVLSDPLVLCKLQPVQHDCDGSGNLVPYYYYDLKMEDCRAAYFGNCSHNLNKFKTLKDCHNRCRTSGTEPIDFKTDKEVFCRLQPDFGKCENYEPMFYFDMSLRTCKGFSYSGCGGNSNRFPTNRDCTRVCRGVASP